MKQRVRDVVTSELTLDYFIRRSSEGWKLASVEWEREQSLAEAQPENKGEEVPLPYGLQVGPNGLNLEENPFESAVLLAILDQIIKERRISDIASHLNLQGYATREGLPWSPTAVFNLMPRLIEAGPFLLKSAAWQQRRSVESKPH